MKRREILGEKPWKFEGKDTNPHAFEHVDLISPIRSGKPPYECRQIAVWMPGWSVANDLLTDKGDRL